MELTFELPKRDGSTHTVSEEQLGKFKEVYRGLDVISEIKKAREWLIANPSRRKVDCHRFLVNWLNRAHEKAPKSVTRDSSQHYAIRAERDAIPCSPTYAPPEVAQAHLYEMRKLLGMRR